MPPPKVPRSTNASGRETRALLIRTAERLFAEQGLDAVSLRQISSAAGLSMYGAVAYHFDDKAGLIRAIIQERTRAADARRKRLMDELERQGRTDDLRALTEAGLRPALEEMTDSGHYFRFLAQLDRHPGELSKLLAAGALGADTLRILRFQEQAARRRLPAAIVEHRIALAGHLAIAALADLEARSDRGIDEVTASDLIDCIVMLYSSPTAT